MVEFALVLPVLALLLFGMIDFGFAYGDYISIRNGSREGARLAVVDTPGSATCNLATSTDNATQNIVCLTKSRVGMTDSDVRVAIEFEDSTPDVGESLTLCVAAPAESMSGFTAPFLNGRTISASTQMRIEVEPSFSAYSEGGLTC